MLIKQGAEAEIHREEWNGRQAIIKKRLPKRYRIPAIDEALRTRRTREEVKLLVDARKAGVRTPLVYDLDLHEGSITMEYIDGVRAKDVLATVSAEERAALCTAIGTAIAALHTNNLIHGDLTTSNIILRDDVVYFIDFGLGSKSDDVETKGVDLHVLMEALTSTHSAFPDCFDHVAKGYSAAYDDAAAVLKRVEEITRRGRYAH